MGSESLPERIVSMHDFNSKQGSIETWRILLVDDDEDDYCLTRTMLGGSRGRVIDLDWADTYQAGLLKLFSKKYDAVLIDYDLGEKTGIEMIRNLSDQGYHAPLILYTSHGSLEVDVEAMQAGATLYLTKDEATPLLLERFIRYAIERKHAEAALSSDLEAMRLIHEVSTHFIENGDISTLLQIVVKYAIQIAGADKGNLQMLDPEKGSLSIVEYQGFERPFLDFFSSVDAAHPSACGVALARSERVVVEDVENDPIFSGQPSQEILRQAGVRAVQSTPLLTRSGQLIGILSTHWSRPHSPNHHTLQLIDLLARQAADFIEKMMAEEELRLAKERYHTLFDSIDEGLCIIQVIFDEVGEPYDYRFLEINRAFEQQTGLYDPVGKTARELVPGLESHWFELYGRVALTGEPVRFEFPAQNMQRWFSGHTFAVGDPEEAKVGILFVDITERKRTEEALLESGRRDAYRIALSDAIRYLQDPNEIQNAATRVLGEHIGANRVHYMDMLPNENKDGVLITQSFSREVPHISGLVSLEEIGPGVISKLEAGRKLVIEDVAYEQSLTDKQKTIYAEAQYAAIIAIPLVKEDRLAAALVASSASPRQWTNEEIALVEETAERTWAAVERARAESALRQSEERFRTMADGTPLIIWVTDSEGKLEFINRAYSEYFGIEDQDLHTDDWHTLVHPEDFEAYSAAFRDCILTGQAFQAEARVRHQSGKWRWIVSFAQPLFSADGSVERMVGSSLDITDRKLAQYALENYTEQLRQSNQALEDFAFVAAHDLREPIRKIQAFADQLRQQASDRLHQSELDYLGRMDQAARRMQSMLDGLLAYSKISLQDKPPDRCDLKQITAQALSDLEYRVREAGARIEVGDLPVIHADPLQMHQLLQNLLANALKFRKLGQPPHIRIYSRSDGDRFIEILVEDNGIGFDMSRANKLFKPFNRLVGKSEYEGSGMGLAICAKIAERHGGSISASSEKGAGSTFIVRLPGSPNFL
jgi:PAS domain S-box-containing protein